MKRCVLCLVVLASGAVAAKPKPAPAPPAKPAASPSAAAVTTVADGSRVDLSADGTLLGWATPRGTNGREIVLLIGDVAGTDERVCKLEDSEAPAVRRDARLYRWRRDAAETLTLVAEKLPRGTLDAADLDGEGVDELLLLREGEVEEVAADGTLRSLVHESGLGARTLDPRSAHAEGDTAFRLSLDGRWTTFRREPGGELRAVSSLDLPVRVVKGASFVRVVVPEAVPVGPPQAPAPLFATMPEMVGNERLRTALLQPEGEPSARSKECWAQLPQPERPLDSAFATIDGVPSLIVTTMDAEKLNLLGEKRLRVFALTGDRTRAGEGPRFAAVTGLNIWQSATPVVTDLDGDRHDDLTLVYWKGLKNAIAALEVYPGKGNGSFGKPRTTDFDVADGDKEFLEFGKDIDGDGRPDLVLLAGGKALVFPGGAPGAAKAVATKPVRTVPLLPGQPKVSETFMGLDLFGGVWISHRPPGLGTPRVLDVDGDGRPELVFAGDLDGRARVSVISFRGAAGAR